MRSERDEAIQIPAQAFWIASWSLLADRPLRAGSVALAMTQAIPFSRRRCVRAVPTTTRKRDSPPVTKEGGEAPKGACQPCAAHAQTSVRNLRHSSAARLRATQTSSRSQRDSSAYGARRPSGASAAALAGTPTPAQLQAMFPGTWNQTGVTRPILSQSSDSTSRLGRSTERPDARSRSGAGCEPARKQRDQSGH